MRRLILMVGALVVGALISAGNASANNCGPMNGPGGMLWPNVQSCQLWIPGLGGLARVPSIIPPHNIPYQQSNIATPFWPLQVGGGLPGGPISPGG